MDRESLVETVAESMAEDDLWVGVWEQWENSYPERNVWIKRARIALAVIEPVVRGECAKVAG